MGEKSKKTRTQLFPGECRRITAWRDGKPADRGPIARLSGKETDALRSGTDARKLGIDSYVLKAVRKVEPEPEPVEPVATGPVDRGMFGVYRDKGGRYHVAPFCGRWHKALGRLAFRKIRGKRVDCKAGGPGAVELCEKWRTDLRSWARR